jgi:dTDP-4-dehydrorhamnose reductase
LWELARQGEPGLYHLGGSERLSRWEIGELLVPWFPELTGRLIQGTARNHAGAPRPRDLSLTCDKIQKLLSFPVPGLRSWLTERRYRGEDLWDYEP